MERKDFYQKRVLEVGSRFVNGSVRLIIENYLDPKEYIGIDIQPGKFVDEIVPVEDMLNHFGRNSFDVVVSTELLEHVREWKMAISNMKSVLKPNGIIFLTTRSFGFPYHNGPYDYWRFDKDDIRAIFSDFNIVELCDDPSHPGVFLKAIKPIDYVEHGLDDIEVYSMITKTIVRSLPKSNVLHLSERVRIILLSSKIGSLINVLWYNIVRQLKQILN